MRRVQEQTGWLCVAVAVVAMGQLPAVADSLLDETFVADTGEAWSPGPRSPGLLNPADESAPVLDDEIDNEFLWAGDRDFGLLMSFDPDDEEIFLGWQVDF